MGAPVMHFEIGCRDLERAKAFYGPLFGWEFSAYGPAAMIAASGPGIGGHLNSLGHEPHNYVTVYATVEDLEGTVGEAVKLGGKLVVGPVAVPGMGRFAWIRDPEGNVIGAWEVAEKG